MQMLNVLTKNQDSDVNASLDTAVMEGHAQVREMLQVSWSASY